ncbi:MAG: Crp/Fnr family transcriptional regulator [Chitinophagales bacterium]
MNTMAVSNISAQPFTTNRSVFPDFFQEILQNAERNGITTRTVKKGNFVYFPNDSCKKVYLMKSGRIKVGSYSSYGKELIKWVLRKGELFGELAILGKQRRNEFAQALDDSEMYALPIDLIQDLMQRNNQVNIELTQLVGDRLVQAQHRLESQLFRDTRSRIIEFIRDLAVDHGQKVGFDTLVKRFFTHQDIANITGTSRQTVTTILNELRADNLIYFNRRKLLVRDIGKLNQMIQ